jgi:ribosome silencing factor RsfS/YbeB/iojap
MKKNDLKRQVAAAIQACLDKKAEELSILEMEKGSGAFTDYFVLCSGTNPRQVQAIADEVELRLKTAGVHPAHVEGYKQGEWILVDYTDFVVHVFSEKARNGRRRSVSSPRSWNRSRAPSRCVKQKLGKRRKQQCASPPPLAANEHSSNRGRLRLSAER